MLIEIRSDMSKLETAAIVLLPFVILIIDLNFIAGGSWC